MNDRLKIGVTGGIGSGKSLVCQIFSCLGAPVYNADLQARVLMENDEDVRSKLKALFGENAYSEHSLNNTYIASRVFSNPSLLEKLNAVVHPRVGEDYLDWSSRQLHSYSIKEAALMFESGSQRLLDAVVDVYAPAELRINRVLKRDPQRSEKEIRDIMDRQFDEKERQRLADYIIYNDESLLVIPQVIKLDKLFKNGG